MMHSGYSMLFLAAVVISARYGGLRSGMIATLLSAVSLHYFFVPPEYSLVIRDISNLIWLIVFASVAFFISTLNESRLRAEAELKLANRQLEGRVEERTAELTHRNEELRNTLAQVKILKGLLPICTECKKIQDKSGRWNEFESYLSEHSEATFNQGICPECAKKVYPNYPFSDAVS
jgi:K+-sensing histidine kinase KdpD